jgi:hypothetical protein
LYKNLLSKDAQTKWSNIVTSQIRAKPWTDLKGKVHNLACRLSMQSFEDCVTFHLLTFLPQDAAEQARCYINVHLKNPSQVKICLFVSQVKQLNGYLDIFQD